MKKFLSILLIIVSILSVFPCTTSLAYGFFDKAIATSNVTLSIGNWAPEITSLINFEAFTNTNTGAITQTINEMSFDLVNVVAGKLSTDKKNQTTSARISQTGSITTTNYYKNYNTLSFYAGMSSAGNTNGSYYINIEVSNNGTSWTNIQTISKPVATLTLYTVNMQSLLTNGITLSDNTIANESTYLKVRISVNSNNANGTRIFNIDDLIIQYTI